MMNLFLIFQYGLVGAFVVLLGTFLSVMVSESVAGSVSQLFGLYTKNKTLQFLGIGMGGVLLALQALMSYKRAKALEDTAKAQAEAAKAQAKATEEQAKANQNTEKGQRQERLKNAIEHLGHASDSVRLGGAYELFHLAEDTKDSRQTVLDILCAHIRQTTGEDEYQKKNPSKPSEEIQSLLTLLFVQEHEVFEGLHINLQGSWLNGANLRGARLEGAILTKAHLRSAYLEEARLHGANLAAARLHGANLADAALHGANLMEASLHGANLWVTSLHGATLVDAALHGANLVEASLHGANTIRASLQGVASQKPIAYSSFAESIRARIDQESDLSGVIFAGGLSQEYVDSIVKHLPDWLATRLREKLRLHIGKDLSYGLPENSGAITGAYTAEEAERWIAEYEVTMAEVPESDN